MERLLCEVPRKGAETEALELSTRVLPPKGRDTLPVLTVRHPQGCSSPLPRLSAGSGVHSPGSSVTSRGMCSPSASICPDRRRVRRGMFAGARRPSSAIGAPPTGGYCSMFAGVRRISSAIGTPMTEHHGGHVRQCGSSTPPSVSAVVPLSLLPPKRIACSPGGHFRISRLSSNERINRVKA